MRVSFLGLLALVFLPGVSRVFAQGCSSEQEECGATPRDEVVVCRVTRDTVLTRVRPALTNRLTWRVPRERLEELLGPAGAAKPAPAASR